MAIKMDFVGVQNSFNPKVEELVRSGASETLRIVPQFKSWKDRWNALPNAPTKPYIEDAAAAFELYSSYWELFDELHRMQSNVKHYIDNVVYGREIFIRPNLLRLYGIAATVRMDDDTYLPASEELSPNYPQLAIAYVSPSEYADDVQKRDTFTKNWLKMRDAYERFSVLCEDSRQVLRLTLPVGPAFQLRNGLWVRRPDANAYLMVSERLEDILPKPKDVDIPF
jgi:hypothetical protein